MILGVFMAMLGLAMIIVGQRMFWVRLFARMRGRFIQGKIAKWKANPKRGKWKQRRVRVATFCPEIEFVDPDGVERRIESCYVYLAKFKEENPIGSPIPVLFDARYPDRSLDTTWTMTYFLPTLLSICGCVVGLIGLAICLSSLGELGPNQVPNAAMPQDRLPTLSAV